MTSQIAETKDIYKRKFYELQSEIGGLKNIMMVRMEKTTDSM